MIRRIRNPPCSSSARSERSSYRRQSEPFSSHLPSAVGHHQQGTVGPQHPAQLDNARRDVRFLHVLQDVIHRDEVERARVGGQVVDRGDEDLRGWNGFSCEQDRFRADVDATDPVERPAG